MKNRKPVAKTDRRSRRRLQQLVKRRFEAKNAFGRHQQRMQDMMYCGRADLVGPDTVIRTLKSMEGEIRCPDCNARMRRAGLDEYKCQKCGEGWTVTAA